MKKVLVFLIFISIVFASTSLVLAKSLPGINGDTITENDSGTIRMETEDNRAGAICALEWNGVDYVNNYDHGRQIQMAVKLNEKCEGLNPTEAGSQLDDRFNPSTSLLCDIRQQDLNGDGGLEHLYAASKPAYWRHQDDGFLLYHYRNPFKGEGGFSDIYGPTCGARGEIGFTMNVNEESPHIMYKNVTVGIGPSFWEQQVVRFRGAITIKADEIYQDEREQNPYALNSSTVYTYKHVNAEMPTGYLNERFKYGWKYSHTNGQHKWTKITSTTEWIANGALMITDVSGAYAMGIWSPPGAGKNICFNGRYYIGQGEKETLKWSVNKEQSNVSNGTTISNSTFMVLGNKTFVQNVMNYHVIGKLYY